MQRLQRPEPRVLEHRRQFQERLQNKQPFMQPRMWQVQARLGQHTLAMQQQVQVQRARRVAVRAQAAMGLFNGQQRVQQRQRLQRSAQFSHGVDEVRAAGLHGCRAVQRRLRHQSGLRQTRQLGQCELQRGLRVAQVSAKPDEDSLCIHSDAGAGPSRAPGRRRRRRRLRGAVSTPSADSAGASAASSVSSA